MMGNPTDKRRKKKPGKAHDDLDLIDDHAIRRRVALARWWSHLTPDEYLMASALLDIIDAKPISGTPAVMVATVIVLFSSRITKQDIAELGGITTDGINKTRKRIYESLNIKPEKIKKSSNYTLDDYPDITWDLLHKELVSIYQKRLEDKN